MTRVFIIHGWGGSSSNDWMPWMSVSLNKLRYETFTPDMPNTNNPQISTWVDKLTEIIVNPRVDDIFIGHSIGCQAILRYLESLPTKSKVYKVILVAPWVTLTNLENSEAWEIADPWLNTPIDFSKVKFKANQFIALFSDNDSWVPIKENKAYFTKHLNPKIIVQHNKGHFTADEGIIKIPELLKVLS